MMNTDGMMADARKALEQEWMRARQPMYEPRERRPKAVAVHPDHYWGLKDQCVCSWPRD